MSRRLPELPAEAVAEYWQLVRAALVAGGMSKAEAAAAANEFREFMKPAGWTIYNRDPEDSARLATKHAAWMRQEQEGGGSGAEARQETIGATCERDGHAAD